MGDRTVLQGSIPPGPGHRTCCMLTKKLPFPFFPKDNDYNIASLDDVTRPHQYGKGGLYHRLRRTDGAGIIYTCRLGFIDLGHVRDLADLTWYYYKQIRNRRDKIRPFAYDGVIEIVADIAEEMEVQVAARMAYDEGIFHEIETYWYESIGCHQSSFAPEDLVSNTLGAFVAVEAIAGGGVEINDFNRLVSEALTHHLLWPPEISHTAVGLDKAGTLAALGLIAGRWIDTSKSSLSSRYLLRRNFGSLLHGDTWPQIWLVQGVPGCPSLSIPPLDDWWRPPLIGPAQLYYTAEYKIPFRSNEIYTASLWINRDKEEQWVNAVNFEQEIAEIRAHAKATYGPNYDTP